MTSPSAPAIDVRGLTKSFGGKKVVERCEGVSNLPLLFLAWVSNRKVSNIGAGYVWVLTTATGDLLPVLNTRIHPS